MDKKDRGAFLPQLCQKKGERYQGDIPKYLLFDDPK